MINTYRIAFDLPWRAKLFGDHGNHNAEPVHPAPCSDRSPPTTRAPMCCPFLHYHWLRFASSQTRKEKRKRGGRRRVKMCHLSHPPIMPVPCMETHNTGRGKHAPPCSSRRPSHTQPAMAPSSDGKAAALPDRMEPWLASVTHRG